MAATVKGITVVAEIAVSSFASVVLISGLIESVRVTPVVTLIVVSVSDDRVKSVIVTSSILVPLISGLGKADVYGLLVIVEACCMEPAAVVKYSLGVVDACDIVVADKVDTGVVGANVVVLKAVVGKVTYVVFGVIFLSP